MALQIIPLFANEDSGSYGDIYRTAEGAKEEHPGVTVLIGYGILDTETDSVVDESECFYDRN